MQNIIIEPVLAVDYKTMEEIKKLRTNITFLDAKVINITSVTGREGKSMISFWLAMTLSDLDKKVVLVDANIRKKHKNTVYNIDSIDVTGLTDYLTDNLSKEDILFKSNYKNLDFIFAGRTPENPAEILTGPKLSDLFNYLRTAYDYVIVDTPSSGEVTDSAILAEHTDGSLLVIEPGMTDYEEAYKVKEQLENSGKKLLGVVINKA